MVKFDPNIWEFDEKLNGYVMKEAIAEKYRKVIDHQVEEWVKGNAKHTNQFEGEFALPEGLDSECCPDFSCCYPEGGWDQHTREVFAKARNDGNIQLINEMLNNSLISMISENIGKSDPRVNIVFTPMAGEIPKHLH